MVETIDHALATLDDIEATLQRTQLVIFIASNVLSFLGGAFVAVCWMALRNIGQIEIILDKKQPKT